MNKLSNTRHRVVVLRFISVVPSALLFVSFILDNSYIASFSLKLILGWMMVSLVSLYLIGLMPSRELIVQLAIQIILPMSVVFIGPALVKKIQPPEAPTMPSHFKIDVPRTCEATPPPPQVPNALADLQAEAGCAG
jgi:hypothetical protein